MVRLLFITERFPPDVGGVARSANRLVTVLNQMGLEVDVLTWSRQLLPGEVQVQAIALCPSPAQLYRVGLYRRWDMSMPQTLNVMEWLHQTHRYDAVWGHYLFPAGFIAVWFAQSQGVASLVSARGNDIDREIFPPGDFARLQWTLERANVITVVSQDLQRKVQRLVQQREILVINNAVDTTVFSPATPSDRPVLQLRRSLGIADREIVLGFSGELREKKGQSFLLKALTAVRQHRPACLLIIGEVRESQDAVLQIYANQHPEDYQRVIVTGYFSDPTQVAQHLRLCDVFLQPSLWDGMPNALLEAMACGVGCIGSDAGGIPEAIDHGQTGFIMPRFQLHHLGEVVLEWFELEKPLQQQIQQQARDRIVRHYSVEQEAIRLKSVIEQLIPNA
jgi:L-malate glycosyltransferase